MGNGEGRKREEIKKEVLFLPGKKNQWGQHGDSHLRKDFI